MPFPLTVTRNSCPGSVRSQDQEGHCDQSRDGFASSMQRHVRQRPPHGANINAPVRSPVFARTPAHGSSANRRSPRCPCKPILGSGPRMTRQMPFPLTLARNSCPGSVRIQDLEGRCDQSRDGFASSMQRNVRQRRRHGSKVNAAVRSPVFARTPGNGSSAKRRVMNLRIAPVS